MDRAGQVVKTVGGMIVARSDDDSHPEIGETVIDNSLDRVGRVVDVIGPVTRPYIIVSPTDDRSAVALLNERLYVR